MHHFGSHPFARALREKFAGYCASNPALHFSAAHVMVKPGHPLQAVTAQLEHGLEEAKHFADGGRTVKNAMHLCGRNADSTLPWDRFDHLFDREQPLIELSNDCGLSTQFLYDVLSYCEMAGRAPRGDVMEARWRSLLFYRTRRTIRSPDLQKRVMEEIGGRGIQAFAEDYRYVVSDLIYTEREG